MKSDYIEKKEARIERLKALAGKAEKESNSAFERIHKITSFIPMGQPILVGHHSEKRHRADIARIENEMSKVVDLSNKADYYSEKAEAAENNKSISSDDPEAATKLKERIAFAEKLQDIMKKANKIIKSVKMTEEVKIAEMAKLGFSEAKYNSLKEADFCGRIGFADYQITNNNANITRMKKRLTQIEMMNNRQNKETIVKGIKVVENAEENRLQLFFDSKPDEQTRTILKRNAFRWSPSNGCWQAFLTANAMFNAKNVLSAL